MKRKDLISRIKVQLRELIQPMKFAEAKAGDLILTSPGESFEVGADIFYRDQDGNNAPLNEGEYTLDSGVKIMVAGGKVTGIFEPEKEAEVQPEESGDLEAASTEVKMESGITMVEFEDMKMRLGKCEEMIKEMMGKSEKMESEFSKFSALPSERPIESKPAEFKPIQAKKDAVSIEDIMSIRERARLGARKR